MKGFLEILKDFGVGLVRALFGFSYIVNFGCGIRNFFNVASAPTCWGGVGHFVLGIAEIIVSVLAIWILGKLIRTKDAYLYIK